MHLPLGILVSFGVIKHFFWHNKNCLGWVPRLLQTSLYFLLSKSRIDYDYKLIAGALYVFISSIAPFKEGLCVRWCFYTHSFITLPLCAPAPPMFYILNLRRIYEVGCDCSSQTRWATDCGRQANSVSRRFAILISALVLLRYSIDFAPAFVQILILALEHL